MESSACSQPRELHDTLTELFQRHGVSVRADGDWLTFPGRSSRLLGLVFDLKDVHPSCSTQVDIDFSPWLGCVICESFCGLGNTREERVQDALERFAQNTFHVLLKVFFGVDCGERTREFHITNGGISRTVTDGNFGCRGDVPEVSLEGRSRWIPEWSNGFEQLLASQPLSEGTHWVRLFYSQLKWKPVTVELLLDNRPWTTAMAAARSLPWPLSADFLSLRVFLVIQGGVDVSRAIGLMARHPDAEDERLESLLCAGGFSVVDARRIILLAPIAFGERVLAALGVSSSTVHTLDDGRTRQTIDLQSSPIFKRACEVAEEAQTEGTMSKDEFLAIAGRDASIDALNKALHAGDNPRDVTLGPQMIFWNESEPLCAPSRLTPATSRKPWWRVW